MSDQMTPELDLSEADTPELSRQLMFGPVRPSPARPALLLFPLWLSGIGITCFATGWGGAAITAAFIWTVIFVIGVSFIIAGLGTLALLLAKREKQQAALKLLNRAVLFAGTVRPYILTRAQILLGLGLPIQAREYLEAKWEEIPASSRDHARALKATCWVHEETNLFEAITEFDEIRKRHPYWRDLALTQGMAYFHLGNYEEAVVHLENGSDIIDKVPKIRRESIYFALGESHREAGDPMHAAKWFKLSRQAIEERRAKHGDKSQRSD